ncbi:MAG: hypothetical protein R6V60_08015 [Desulfobacterales bacterium]
MAKFLFNSGAAPFQVVRLRLTIAAAARLGIGAIVLLHLRQERNGKAPALMSARKGVEKTCG